MRKLAPDLPFLIVSGAAPEDVVTAAMRQGAHDFIAKGNLVRLVPVVRRELKEADLRRDQRRMKVRLAENEERMAILAAAVEQVPDAVAIVDPAGAVSYVNRSFERLTGFSGVQIRACALGGVLHNRAVDEAVLRAAEGGLWEGRLTLALEGGPAREVDTTFSPVRDPGQAIRHLVAVFRDVTKEAELERQLRQAQKLDALGMLATGLAHDFNNVLTTILAAAELVRCKLPEHSPLLAKMDVILHAGLTASGLTRQVLGFGRRAETHQVPLDLSATVREAVHGLRATLPAGVELVEDLMSGVWVEGDPAQIHQVVLNLGLNAIRACAARRRPADHPGRGDRSRTDPAGGAHRARHRLRHGRRPAGADLRAVLHHQADRRRHRAGPGHGAFGGDQGRRPDRGAKRAGPGHQLPHPAALRHRPDAPGPGGGAAYGKTGKRRPGPGAGCCWRRTATPHDP